MYFNGARSHRYEYGLHLNVTRTSSFCAGRVFIQLVESKLLVNSINIIYKNRGPYLTSELMSLQKSFIVRDVQFVKIVTL